jgi:hypothetical protein
MPNDYAPVKEALAGGADPAMLCATCPWDRNCVTPPQVTSAEVEQLIKKAGEEDELKIRADGPGSQRMPVSTLLAVAIYAGKDTALQACPVLGIRLRDTGGRKLADQVRSLMQSWQDQ